jgi:protein phosphatase 1L
MFTQTLLHHKLHIINLSPSQVGEHLILANAGDCRAVLCRGGHALRLTCDHTPDMPEERARIEGERGIVHQVRWSRGKGGGGHCASGLVEVKGRGREGGCAPGGCMEMDSAQCGDSASRSVSGNHLLVENKSKQVGKDGTAPPHLVSACALACWHRTPFAGHPDTKHGVHAGARCVAGCAPPGGGHGGQDLCGQQVGARVGYTTSTSPWSV